MNWGDKHDAGARFKTVFAAAEVDVTAAGTGDATEFNGALIDRKGFYSLDVALAFTAALQADETLSFIANFQDADELDGSGVADVSTDYAEALTSTLAATGDSGGSTETGSIQFGVDLTMFRRYVRVQITPDLSASGTDTAKISSLYILGGADKAPASADRVNLRATP